MTFDQGQGHKDQYQNVVFDITYFQTELELNRFINVQMHTSITLLNAVSRTAVFPLMNTADHLDPYVTYTVQKSLFESGHIGHVTSSTV